MKVLYVRNLKSDFNEDKIKELFEPFGPILRIKKLKDYAFVHFEEREHAVNVSIIAFKLLQTGTKLPNSWKYG